MITSLITSLLRVTLTWYVIGLVVMFMGAPAWAETAYRQLLALFPWVPQLKMEGITTAASVQWNLLVYWTAPMVCLWLGVLIVGGGYARLRVHFTQSQRTGALRPTGEYYGVTIPSFSLGALPEATTPKLEGLPVRFNGREPGRFEFWKSPILPVQVTGSVAKALELMTNHERALAEELLQLLVAKPDHFAGLGHGVGLLVHSLNVLSEAAEKCRDDFRLPFIAALAHDIGKLVTFQQTETGEWVRKGLHSRESARILSTLPSFRKLPENHQTALLLAVKYDHAPNKMPVLRGDRDANMLALRIINALSAADKTATSAEKERNLEKLKPEDLLWQDFVTSLRDAPVVQKGKKGSANQVNNPPDSPYLYIYEAPWREAAIKRMPAEVAAALDLSRRDSGKIAKYTRILAAKLRGLGLLLEECEVDGKTLQVTDSNPLWDIQSGTGEKAVMLRGILVIHADALWKAVNYRIGTQSPYPVKLLAPNAEPQGASVPEAGEGLKVPALTSVESLAEVGLGDGTAPAKQKTRTRSLGPAMPPVEPVIGLQDDRPAVKTRKAQAPSATRPKEPGLPASQVEVAPDAPRAADPAPWTEAAVEQEMELELAHAQELLEEQAQEQAQAGANTGSALADAMKLFAELQQPDAEPAPDSATGKATAKVVEEDNAAQPKNEPALEKKSAPTLSRAEQREGILVADAEACARYPELSEGDKYYSESAPEVQHGRRRAGDKYTGLATPPVTAQTPSGPRRGKIRRLN